MSEIDELALQATDIEKERLRSLINSMADGVVAIDGDLKIALSNGAALNILDINGSLIGRYITRVLHLLDKDNQPVHLRKIITDTRTSTTSRDWHVKYQDGSEADLYISIAPVHLGFEQEGGEELSGFVLLIRDITREQSLEEERDEFISVVSHELRTPIAIAEGNIGNAEFILEKTQDLATIKEALNQAHEQINFLSDMMNDLSTLSRAERGKLTVEVEPINAHDLVTELVDEYTPEARKKGLAIGANLDPSLELLNSGKLYVHEILQNFLTNAIKYTNEGSIEIGAKRNKNGIIFSVSDTGIGISKSDRERVFDKFFRSEDFRTRKTSGTGLGLYVAMKLARLIHADIDLKSELNEGTTFFIHVPNLQ